MEKICKIIDFKYFKNALVSIAIFILCLLTTKFLGITRIEENSLLENIQLVALAAGFVVCLKAKKHKTLFRFTAMIIFLMFMRELSYGRCIFCQLPDNPHEFYKWSHYKYGWLAHVFIGIYIASAFLYAIVNKIWIDIKNIFVNVRLPFLDILTMAFLTIVQLLGEKILDSTILEETAEFTLYVAICLLVYYFYKKSTTK